MEEFERIYPEKPTLIEKKTDTSLAMTVFSLVLFVWAFFTFISDDWRFISLIITVLLIHELGHFLMMKLFRYEKVRLMFIPLLGAMVHGEKEQYSQRQRTIVLLAGPIPGIIIGIILMYWAGNAHHFWGMYAGLLFTIINALNLFPIDPLDGGQLTKVLFFNRQELFQLIYAFVSSLAMIGLGLYLENWILVAFGFFLGTRVRAYQKLYLIRKELKSEQIEFIKNYKELSNKEFYYIKKVFLGHSPSISKLMESAMVEDEVSNELISNEVNNILETPTLKDANLFWKIIFTTIWLSGIAFSTWIFLKEYANLDWFIDAFKSWR